MESKSAGYDPPVVFMNIPMNGKLIRVSNHVANAYNYPILQHMHSYHFLQDKMINENTHFDDKTFTYIWKQATRSSYPFLTESLWD